MRQATKTVATWLGLLAGIAGLSVLVWAAVFVQRKHGGLILALLSLSILLVGGGFVPLYIGMVASVTASGFHAPIKPLGVGLRWLAYLWPWTLLLIAVWFPGSWLLGYFFSQTMMALSGFLFLFFSIGLPYNRVGYGPLNLVIFQGLTFENKPLPAHMNWLYSQYYQYLAEAYTTYIVLRKPGLPDGYSLQDMADDYATMIKDELGGPVDVMGVSTGGSIAQHFAADHPELVRKLVIHSSAYTLSDLTKRVQMRVGYLARQCQWRAAYAMLVSPTRYPKPVIWIGSLLSGMFGAPEDPSDLVVTIEAEDKFNFKEHLRQITAPTLVIAGDSDPFYPVALFRETAAGIPNARLILYEKMGHPAFGKQFRQDVLAFLTAN